MIYVYNVIHIKFYENLIPVNYFAARHGLETAHNKYKSERVSNPPERINTVIVRTRTADSVRFRLNTPHLLQ